MEAFAALTLGEQPAPSSKEDGRAVAEQSRGMSSEWSSTGTKKDLPIELWMHIFDFVTSTRDLRLFARSDVLQEYQQRLKTINLALPTSDPDEQMNDSVTATDIELEAAKRLPRSEQSAWLVTRAYYKINSNSRAAAKNLRVSSRLLATSRRLVYVVDGRPRTSHVIYLGAARNIILHHWWYTVFELPPWPLGKNRAQYINSFHELLHFVHTQRCTQPKWLSPFRSPEEGEAMYHSYKVKLLVPRVHPADVGGCPRAYRFALACDVAKMLRELWAKYECKNRTVEVI